MYSEKDYEGNSKNGQNLDHSLMWKRADGIYLTTELVHRASGIPISTGTTHFIPISENGKFLSLTFQDKSKPLY